MVNFNKILHSDDYEVFKENIKSDIIKNIECRLEEVQVYFSEEDKFSMNKGNLLTFLIIARPFRTFKENFNGEFIIDVSDVDNFNIYFDSIIEYFIDKDNLGVEIRKVIDELSILTGFITKTYGTTISLKSICDLAKRNSNVMRLLNYDIDTNQEFDTMIKNINDSNDELIDEILNDNNTPLADFLNAKAGINNKQLCQVLVTVGPKPDLNENIIPFPINSSFVRGLGVREYFINSIGGRKALISSRFQVRNAGYFTRKLIILCIDSMIDPIDDCGTKHPVPIKIDCKETLKKLNNRKYVDENGVLRTIDKDNEELIGKSVLLRTPVTCASKNGICRTCYGELYKINESMNIGMIAVLLLTNPLTQRLLSAKHLLQANASKLNWCHTFLNNFNVNRDLITPKNKEIKIFINRDNLEENEELESITFNKFEIIDINDKRKKEIITPLPLLLNSTLLSNLDKYLDNEEDCYKLNLNDIEEDEYLFKYVMENNGLSSSLLSVKNFIEKNDFIKEGTIESIMNQFNGLLNDANLNIHFIHTEVILSNMLKLSDVDRSVFKEDKMPNYKFLRVTDAILHSNSLVKSLLFEQISKQFTTLNYNTFNKNSSSILDELIIN